MKRKTKPVECKENDKDKCMKCFRCWIGRVLAEDEKEGPK